MGTARPQTYGLENVPTPKGDSIRCIRLPSSLKTAANPSLSTLPPIPRCWTLRRRPTSPSTRHVTATARAASAWVKILEGTVDSTPTHHISEEDYAAGWRLSCASKPTSDVVVQVPDIASAYQSRMKTADLSTGEEVATFNKLQEDIREAGVDISCDFVSAVLELSEPTLDDTMPDTERLALAAQNAFDGCTEVKLTYHTVKKLAKTLREANFKVQIAGTLDMGVLTVMDVTGKLDAPMIGCAIDIGHDDGYGRASQSRDRRGRREGLFG